MIILLFVIYMQPEKLDMAILHEIFQRNFSQRLEMTSHMQYSFKIILIYFNLVLQTRTWH